MKLLIFFACILFSQATPLAELGCLKVDEVTEDIIGLFGDVIKNEVGKDKTKLIKSIKDNSSILGTGSYGVVYGINGKNEIGMKEIHFMEVNPNSIKRQIKMMKKACGIISNPYEKVFYDCKESPIASYRGCISTESSAYIFQNKSYKNFEDTWILFEFQILPPIKKVEIMLKIMDKFAFLHFRGVIHSDIKPESIMSKDMSLSDFEIVDLGLSEQPGQLTIGGTDLFLAPEANCSSKLTPQIDVYGLALTLIDFFFSIDIVIQALLPHSCKGSTRSEECHQVIEQLVENAFNCETDLTPLKSTFKIALSFLPQNRFESIESFSKSVVDSLHQFPNSEEFISEIVAQKREPVKDLQLLEMYRWKDYLRESEKFRKELSFITIPLTDESEAEETPEIKKIETSQKIQKAKPAKEGFFDKVMGLFCCSYKKDLYVDDIIFNDKKPMKKEKKPMTCMNIKGYANLSYNNNGISGTKNLI